MRPIFPPNLDNLVTASITDRDNSYITAIPDSEEIRSTVFAMNFHKSPGLDSFSPLFFKQYWHIVSNAVIQAIRYAFSSGHILQQMNDTFLALIP